MVEKVPEFSAESLCLHEGMVTSGRWCHMTLQLVSHDPEGSHQRPLVTIPHEGREILPKTRELFPP